jgi:hypothetical protein
MKKKLYSLAFLASAMFATATAFAQEQFLWVRSAGADMGWEEAAGIARDNSGNIYVAGTFQGRIYFGSTSILSSGASDVIVAKYNSAGSLQWARKVGQGVTFGGNEIAKAITVNAAGTSIYVLASYSNSSDSLNFLTNNTIKIAPSTGAEDLFVARLDGAGAVNWATKIGGSGIEDGGALALINNTDLLVTGTFTNDLNVGAFTLNSFGNADIFIAKYDNAGNVVWATQAGGTNTDIPCAIKANSATDFYITGNFRGSADFDATTLVSAGETDAFIAKYDSAGVLIYADNGGGAGNDNASALFIDSFNQVYIAGYYSGTANIGAQTLTSLGSKDIFILKLDNAEQPLWVKTARGNGENMPSGIYVAGTGNNKKVYLSGTFENTIEFGVSILTGNAETKAATGQKDMFIAYYDSLGNTMSSVRAGGLSLETCAGIVADNSNNMYVFGAYRALATFSPTNITASGGSDLYIARYGLNTTGIAEAAANKTMQVYPNPSNGAITIQLTDATDYEVKVYDVRGVCVSKESVTTVKHQIDLTHLPNGVYFLNAIGNDKSFQQKIVIQK